MMEFIMVDTPFGYNALLRRPILIGLGAVTSVRHLAMKFSTLKGTGIVRGDQLAAREAIASRPVERGMQPPRPLSSSLKLKKAKAIARVRDVED